MERVCSVDGCSNIVKGHSARKMCKTHYARFLAYGDPMAPDRRSMRVRNVCSVDGCTQYCVGHGFCGKHYQKYRKYGDPLFVHRKYAKEHIRERKTWDAMVERCSNPKHPAYRHYGGRGIKVCDRWLGLDGFYRFLEDMGPRPEGCSLDRIDNNKGYSPENCRWADGICQQNNKSNNHYMIIGGAKKSVTAWARKYGVKPETAFSRLRKGECGERVFRKPWT